MRSNTKIIILKAKELIYTLIFIALGIILIALLLYMFSSKNKDTASAESDKYVPGVYSSTVNLGDSTLNIQVTVDKDTISNVSVFNIDEAITTMYPLLEPALDEINSQIATVDNIDDINYSSENQYTYIILNQAIKNAVDKAKVESN